MSAAIDRLLAIEQRIDALWVIQHDAIRERESLKREKSSILMCISWAERQEFDQVLAERAVRALTHASAVGARREE
jgi:hypothetical protein